MKNKIIFLILLVFLSSGCSSYTELNDLSIVNTLAIDYKDNKYELILQIIEGINNNDSIEKEITTLSSNENSLDESFNKLYINSKKKLYLSHIDLLILTEEAINNNLIEITTNFLENNEYRNNFNVVLLKDIPLKEFMENKVLAEDINNLVKTNQKETSITRTKDFEEMIKDLLINGNTYLPTISYHNNELSLKGYTLINNYKIYEELSYKDSILLNLLSNQVMRAYLNGNNIYDNQTIITTKNNNISFKFLTTIDEDKDFINQTKIDLENFLKKYQEKNYDILKLTEKVRKNNYSYYKNTPDLLEKLTFNFTFILKEKENYLQGDAIYETK